MKYSKAIRVAAMSLALSLAMPGQVFAAPEGAVVTGKHRRLFRRGPGISYLPAGITYWKITALFCGAMGHPLLKRIL